GLGAARGERVPSGPRSAVARDGGPRRGRVGAPGASGWRLQVRRLLQDGARVAVRRARYLVLLSALRSSGARRTLVGGRPGRVDGAPGAVQPNPRPGRQLAGAPRPECRSALRPADTLPRSRRPPCQPARPTRVLSPPTASLPSARRRRAELPRSFPSPWS